LKLSLLHLSHCLFETFKKTTMKNLLFLTAFAAVSFSPFAKVNILAPFEPAQPFNIQNDVDLTGLEIYDVCTGEWIYLSGTEHMVIHGLYNPSTGTSTTIINSNYEGVSGVGETTGNTYRVVSTVAAPQRVSSNGYIITQSAVVNRRFITAGGENYYQKVRITFTYNSCTSESSVQREVFEDGCR
jgi:hypothetical protein